MDTDSIEIGDIFEDNDPRTMRAVPVGGPFNSVTMRRVKVVGRIQPRQNEVFSRFLVEDVTTGLCTKIRTDRLRRGGKRGFTRVTSLGSDKGEGE